MFARSMFTTILQKVCKARIHNPFAKRVFYNNIYNVHTDTLFPHSYSFIYSIHTRGIRVAGSPLFLRYNSFVMSICQQRELPLFLVAVAGKFFLFSFGKGRVTGVLFISSDRGGVFKGSLSSRVYLYCWLPK